MNRDRITLQIQTNQVKELVEGLNLQMVELTSLKSRLEAAKISTREIELKLDKVKSLLLYIGEKQSQNENKSKENNSEKE